MCIKLLLTQSVELEHWQQFKLCTLHTLQAQSWEKQLWNGALMRLWGGNFKVSKTITIISWHHFTESETWRSVGWWENTDFWSRTHFPSGSHLQFHVRVRWSFSHRPLSYLLHSYRWLLTLVLKMLIPSLFRKVSSRLFLLTLFSVLVAWQVFQKPRLQDKIDVCHFGLWPACIMFSFKLPGACCQGYLPADAWHFQLPVQSLGVSHEPLIAPACTPTVVFFLVNAQEPGLNRRLSAHFLV